MKVNNYIENVYRELLPYQNIEYEDLYETFKNSKLQEIFSTIHYLLMDNYKAMNSRLPTRENTAHFWADNSRKLILAIDCIQGLQRGLKNSSYKFTIDPYYEKVINESNSFLSNSGGSEIPPFMEKVELYYTIPIFNSRNSIDIKSLYNSLNVELKFIGEGSYANVYKYKDPFYKKFFVVKRAKDNLNAKEIERFQREFNAMKGFKSPYIVEVYNYDENKNEYYMEYMDATLDEYIQKNNTKLNVARRIGIVRQILRAFEYIHSKENLHRDISPKNILIKNYDDVTVIKIADFGLIKIPESQLTNMWTEFKGYFNDPSLIVDGFHTYDMVHETYALTRIVIFVMTGKINLNNIKNESIKSLIQKGLCPEKEKRFQSVEELTHFFNSISFDNLE